ncbi:MAG: cobalt transporter CbiM [Candidatus Korobacteraceae bacterium]
MRSARRGAILVMHIPDGYLSPSTCAVLYTGAAAGWYSALKRLKRVLLSRIIPLISVFAAFSFVVMMFNLPLPGGTTGHALGVTIAAIVLGPSGAILALSIAIAIQALFFGDGGISTLGANCFNMAIVGSLVAYASYRLIAAGAALTSRRRVVAAAIAGYLAVNAAALFAAVEFGIQPALFHDANGTPLYAPYRLSVAIPAMMIGHLTFAGLAEAAISAGLVAYLQVADPALLRSTSGVPDDAANAATAERLAARSIQTLWIAIAALMLVTPVGILAAGTAWGEWSPAQLAKAPAIAQDVNSPQSVPTGLQRLSNLWTAPFPAYAPSFVHSRGFGYLLSAMFGVGFLLAASLVLRLLLQRHRQRNYSA